MLYFIVLTTVCDLHCKYCGNDPEAIGEPYRIAYDIAALRRFISKDPHPTICFYGGEPLLAVDLLETIMDEIEAERWILQTNGLHLDRLGRRYLERFDTILVSIDGRPEVTDYYRGEGVYERVLEQARRARARGFKGDLIARMAASGRTDIYLDVKHLLELKDPKFDHVHWQLDALWDYPPAQRYDDFGRWLREVYNPGISRLVRYWVERMEEDGVVLGIVPFLGTLRRLRRGGPRPPCGAGVEAFAITTSGKILACPVAYGFEEFVVGHIAHSEPHELPGRVTIGPPCTRCDLVDVCGGRCLFANRTKLWGDEGFALVCESVRHLVRELRQASRRILELVERGVIDERELDYPRYNNTTEIIP